MIEFNVEYKEKETLEKGSFKMVLQGLGFLFEEIGTKKLINPFYCNKTQVEIAKEILKDSSVLLWDPKKIMNFETEGLLIKVTSDDL